MTEMVTSGSMSGEGKRSDGLLGESGNERRRPHLAPPVLDATALLFDSTGPIRDGVDLLFIENGPFEWPAAAGPAGSAWGIVYRSS
jgi:hypothetical protein